MYCLLYWSRRRIVVNWNFSIIAIAYDQRRSIKLTEWQKILNPAVRFALAMRTVGVPPNVFAYLRAGGAAAALEPSLQPGIEPFGGHLVIERLVRRRERVALS